MSKTSEVQPSSNGKPSPERRGNPFAKAAQRLGEVAVYAWGVITGRGSGKRAKDTSSTIAPEYPVYPEPSFPEFVTTPDGNRSPVESGNTPATLIEPPEPTPDELAIIEQKDKARAAATKDSSSVKPSTPEKPVDVSENEPKYYSLDDLIYGDVPKSEADEILKNAYGTAHEPKTLDELIDNPNISQDEADEILDRVYGSSSEKNDRKDDANSTEGSQESSTTESGNDEQVKDSNPDTGEAQAKEISPEEHKAAANLKIARERFAKASIAVESHFFKEHFGGKKRQEELDAATEELKQSELEYMRLKFADKIEAAKQDPKKQAELAAEMGQAAFASIQETSRTTTDKYDSMLDDRGKFKKAAAKVGKWFNKGGKIAQWLKLGGAGFAVGATTAAFAGWPITVAVGVVTKLGVAGATKQAVLEEHRGEDRIDADASLGTIDPSFEKAVANMKIDDVMEHAVNVSVDNLKDVSIERRDALRKKVLSSSGKYAVGLVLGGLAGKYVGDWASQSGGKELKTHLLEKVDNTKPGSVDPVGNYTPGLDSLYGYDPSKHEFLWQWAESVYGEGNGTSGIMHTVDVLRDNGYIVDIINNPNGSFSVVVDGVSDTEGLVKIFSQFVN